MTEPALETVKAEMNEEIAKYFGFEKSDKVWDAPGYFEDGMPEWTYPENWYLSQGGTPNFSIPDFVTILEDYLKLMKEHGAFGKREYFEMFNSKGGI